ncbi:MAG: response regulator [Xenococcaceae cyanobacterium MO_234.B1]|nr:response regulator [Xenococcaceae cyanobacterium MO_234.B1]
MFHTSHKYSSLFEQYGFKNISLNCAPKVLDINQLQAKIDLNTYGNLIHLFNGQLTWRDLSLKLNKHVIKLIRSLAPYCNQEILEFREIPDLASNFTAQQYISQFLKGATSEGQFTVTCIDDNNQVHQMMNQIVTHAGGRLVGIKDEFEVLPRLMEHTPDVIFLKMAMPIVNGYELCAQIKRVPKLNQIPIIMLFENNYLTERMRAKLVGASGFMTQPFDQQQITKILEKFAYFGNQPAR